MFANYYRSVSPLSGSVRLAAIAASALLAAACHGGLESPTGPSAPSTLSSTSDGDSTVVASALAAPVAHDMASVNASGYWGTCTLSATRNGFRLKANGDGTPGTVVRFHLIRADGYRTTTFAEVKNSGGFRTDQTVVDGFPPNAEVRCVLMSLEDATLAESSTFNTP